MRATDDGGRRGRIPRLEREEQDLRDRLATHVSSLDRVGRDHRSDPLYQSLTSVLARVRRLLAHAQGEDVRKAGLFFGIGERRRI